MEEKMNNIKNNNYPMISYLYSRILYHFKVKNYNIYRSSL